MKKIAQLMAAMMALGIVAGCKVGPNYHRPVVQPPTAYRDLSENHRPRRRPRPMRIFLGGRSSRTRNYKSLSARR